MSSRIERFDAFLKEALAEPHRKGDRLEFVFVADDFETDDADKARDHFDETGYDIESRWRRKPVYLTRNEDDDPEQGWSARVSREAIDIRWSGKPLLRFKRTDSAPERNEEHAVVDWDSLGVVLGLIQEALPLASPGEPVKSAREALYELLDDIDTLDDACRDDDLAFRTRVREIHQKRFLHAVPEGDHDVLRWEEDG